MFDSVKRNYGTAGITLPLMALMGEIFHVGLLETILAALLFYVLTLVLMVIDDFWVPYDPNEGAPYTEEELLEIDQLVAPKAQLTIVVQGS